MVNFSGKFRSKKLLIIYVALLIAIGASVAQGKLSPQPSPAIWQATGKQGKAYLLGTLNIGNKDFYPLNPMIEKLFSESANLVVTVDLTKINPDELNQSILAEALLAEDKALTDHLSPTELDLCTATFARYGIPLDQVSQFRPWFLMVMVEALHQQTLGYFSDQSLDIYFLNKAEGKTIIGLETPVFQATLFAHFSPALEKLLLLTTLNSDLTKETEELVTAWWQGDLARIESNIFAKQEQDPIYLEYNEKIYFSRNRRIAAKINSFLANGGTYFVLLPCGHFFGKERILELLKAEGITVERLAI